MRERYHVLDFSCSEGGWRDHGACDSFWEAAEAVRALIAKGIRGGCRCHRGFEILPCSKLFPSRLQHGGGYIRGTDCRDFSAAEFESEAAL